MPLSTFILARVHLLSALRICYWWYHYRYLYCSIQNPKFM